MNLQKYSRKEKVYMTKLKTRLPIKALSVLMALLMIFSTMSIMFTVSAADEGLPREKGGGYGTWISENVNLSVNGLTASYSMWGGYGTSSYSNENIQYSVYLPKDYESYASNADGKKLAVMLVLSGGGAYFNTDDETNSAKDNETANNSGELAQYAMARATGLNKFADEKGIILIYFRQPNTDINTGYYWNFFLSSDQGRSNTNYTLPKIVNEVKSIKSQYSDYVDDERTYVTGISAGGALAECFAAVYPDEFAGAAIVAGLPYMMLDDDNYATGNQNVSNNEANYQKAMDGSWTSYPTYSTLAGYITSAWSKAGKTSGIRTIVLQGGKDKVVHPKNGRLIAMANAQALGVFDGNTSSDFNSTSFTNTFTGDETGKGYTVHYYGLDTSTKKTSDGYSKLAASQVVYYQVDNLAHQWVNRYADGFYSTKPSYVDQNTSVDYNQIMWEFFEGDNTPEDVVEPITTETVAPSYGALFGIKQDRGANNNNADSTIRDSEFVITGLDLVSAQGLTVTTNKLAYDYLATSTLQTSEVDGLWNFTFNIKDLYDAKVAQYPDKDVSIKSISVKQNVWAINYSSPMICLSYKVVDKLAIETTDDAVKGQDAERIDVLELAPDNENDLLSGVINDEEALEALKTGYLNIVTFDSAYGSNYNAAAPVIEVEFEVKDKPVVDDSDENDVEVEGDAATTRTSNKLFPIFAYNSAAGYNAVEASTYETKTYDGSTESFVAGTAGHLQATTKKYSVGVYNADDANDTIYYSFNLADYTKNNGYTIKSVTIKYTLEGNPYYSKQDVGVKMYLAGNSYWSDSASAPAKGDMVTVENFTLAKGEKIEGEITISADDQSKLINYINNLGGLTVAFENTALNEHYYFLSTMPTITVNYEEAKNGTPGIITGIGVRTDKSYSDLTETTEPVTNQTLSGITVSSEKNYYSNTYNATGEFSETSGTNKAVLSNFNIYKAVVDAIKTELEVDGKKVSDIQFTVNSATFTVSGQRTTGYTTYYAYGNYNETPQSEYITNGNQLTATSNQNKVSVTLNSTGSTKSGSATISFSDSVDFTEDTPYLWTKVAGSNANTTVDVPTITNLSVTYSATVTKSLEPDNSDDGDDDNVEPIKTVTATDPANSQVTITVTTDSSYKYVKLTSDSSAEIVLNTYSEGQDENVFTTTLSAPSEDTVYTVFASKDGSEYSDKTKTVTVKKDTATNPITPPSGGTTVTDQSKTITQTSSAYNTNQRQLTSTSTTYWKASTSYTGSMYGIIMNYNLKALKTSLESEIRAELAETYPTSKYNIEVYVTLDSLTLEAKAYSASSSYPKTFYVNNTASEYTVYNSVLTTGTAITASVSSSGTTSNYPLTLVVDDVEENYLSNNFVTLYFGAPENKANYAITTMPTTTLGYSYTYSAKLKDPIQSATVSEPTNDGMITFTVTTDPTYTQVKIGSQTLTSYNVVDGYNVFTYTIEAPSVATSYTVVAAKDGVDNNEFARTIEVKGFDPDPIQSVEQNAGSTEVVFTVSTYKSYKYVKVINSSTNAEFIISNYTQNGASNIFQVNVPAPENDTTYIVYASKDGATYDTVRSVTSDVKGTKVVVLDRVINATGNFFNDNKTGTNVKIDNGTSYEDIRTVTTSTSESVSESAPVTSGYLVGTNSSYYTTSDSNYYTSGRRSTGSPQANTSIKTSTSTFPVSYLGYGYLNYDLSSAFAHETSTYSDWEEDPSLSKDGVKVEIRTRTETVVTGIKISAVQAQEGYTGGWAARYTVSGETWVTGGSAVPNGANKPTNFQNLGNGDVSTSMANIGAAASLNDEQLAKARDGKNVTVWINNTGCDWNSRYFSSAWLLVEIPTVTVTTKTITYTDKRITETKSTANESIITKSDVTEGTEKVTNTVSASSGYLWGRGYHTTSSSSYRTDTVSPTTNQLSTVSNYNAQANVNLKYTTEPFAVTYLGKGYVLYNVGNATGGTDRESIGETTTKKVLVGGQFVDATVETYKVSTVSISGIKVEGKIQAGFQANSGTSGNNANSYNITNMVYAAGTDTWSGTGYPTDDASWQALNVVYGIKKTQKSYTGYLNEDTIADVIENGYLTIRVDNCFNDWQSGGTLSNAYIAAWTLVTIPTVTLEYTTMEYTETVVTPIVDDVTVFKPTYEVYAQYNFISADGDVLSKTKPLGTLEGYGASANVTPYYVDPVTYTDENGQEYNNLGKVTTLFRNGVLTDETVEISMDGSRKDKYVLKDAYIEDVNTDIADISVNADGSYTINTLIDDGTKTNNTYKIRVIFDYYMEESTTTNTENSVKVNLHSIFELDGEKTGEKTASGFAYLHNSSYIMSLDDVNIPYGDLTLDNGEVVSAVFGSNRIYKFDNTKTRIEFAGASVTNSSANNTDINTSDYQAKAYLDIANGTPKSGDILVVTYNGDNSVANQEIDVYLYYTAEQEYTVDVNYEFRLEGSFGEAVGNPTVIEKPDQTFYKGSMVPPYDLLEDASAVVTVNGVEYNVSDFNYTITSTDDITLTDDGVIVSATGSNPTVTYVYTYKDKIVTRTDATVKHVYNIVYGNQVVDTVELPTTTAVLGNPADSSVAVIRDNTDVVSATYGTFKASQFTPVSVSGTNGLVFGDYSDGKYPTVTVPQNTPNAEVTITYELEVYKLNVTETFTQNGEYVRAENTTTVYIPKNNAYTFTSTLDSDMVPNAGNDEVKLSQYVVTASGVTLTNDTPGSVSFAVVGFTGDMNVTINYEHSTNAQVPINLVHQFYKNGVLVGTKTENSKVTLTNPGAGQNSYEVELLTGTVDGISGSISSAIVDADHYIFGGVTEDHADLSLTGNTITYTNADTKGNQDAIDVIVRYDIDDTATVNVVHKFYINGTDVTADANVTNAPTSSLNLTTDQSVTVDTLAQGTVTYNGTTFDISKFTASAVASDKIGANGLNVTLTAYNIADNALTVEVRYDLTVRTITVTEVFKNSTGTLGTETSTLYVADGDEYTFASEYVSYSGIAISNFIDRTIADGYVLATGANDVAAFTSTASADADVTITYTVGTQTTVTVTHTYNIVYGGQTVATVTLPNTTQTVVEVPSTGSVAVVCDNTVIDAGEYGTYTASQFAVNSITGSTGVTFGAYADGAFAVTGVDYNVPNATATITYELVVNKVTVNESFTKNNSPVGTTQQTIAYAPANSIYSFVSELSSSYVPGTDGVKLSQYTASSADVTLNNTTGGSVSFDGLTLEADKVVNIVYAYSTYATVQINLVYRFHKDGATSVFAKIENKGAVILTNNPTGTTSYDIPLLSGDVTDQLASNPGESVIVDADNYVFVEVKESSSYIDASGNTITFVGSNVEGQLAAITVYIDYNVKTTSIVNIVHEYYVNGSQVTPNVTNTPTKTHTLGVGGTSKSITVAKGSYTDENGKTYDLVDFTKTIVAPEGITVDGTKIALTRNNVEDNSLTVTVKYELETSLNSASVTVNSHYVNAGEYVGELFTTETKNVNVGDVIESTVTKTIHGAQVVFTVDKVVGNGVTIENVNGVYTVTEIAKDAAEWSIDVTYVASAVTNVNLTHNFYVGGKLLGTITDATVVVNPAHHSGKFVARNGIVAVTTENGVILVDASKFTVTLANGGEYGTFADGIYTLNADAFNGSTYNVVFDYNIDSISYALDGEVGIKQTASAITTDGQYNVITTVTSIGNTRPIDLVFVVDVSDGMATGNTDTNLAQAKAAIKSYIENSFAVNSNVRVAIVTYADDYEIVTGYITDKDAALAAVESISLAKDNDGYGITTSNLQAGLYGARTLINSDVRGAYTDVIVIKGSEANAAYSKYNATSYKYSVVVGAAEGVDAEMAIERANYELDMMNADKEIIIDLTDTETDINEVMTETFDARNYINVNGEIYITINADEFTFVKVNGVKVNGVALADDEYRYRERDGLISIPNLGTLKGEITIEYTLELTEKVEGDYFVSDEIKIAYVDSITGEREIVHGVSARVSYSTTITGSTITVIPYLADSNLNPLGTYGFAVEKENAIIGEPIVYAVSGVTNLTAGNTYTVKAPVVSGYTLQDAEQSVKTIEIPAAGENAVVYFGYYASGALVDDSIVYDDTSDLVFDVLANDTRPNGDSFDYIYGIGATESEAINNNRNEVKSDLGTLIILDGGKVKFTPAGIGVTGEFYYAVQDGDEIRVGVIYVVPATIVKADVTSEVQLTVGEKWTLVHEVNEEGETEVSADKSTPDYNPNNIGLPTNKANESGNLVAGMNYTLSVDPAEAGDGSQYVYKNGNLTDGVTGDLDRVYDEYLGWYGETNETVFDLGITHKLTSVVVNYMVYENAAVRTPQFTLSVSDDGVNYEVYKVYTIANEANDVKTVKSLELEIDSAVSGRYVKITTTPVYGAWIFLSEIEIYGSKNLALGSDYTTETDGKIYISTDDDYSDDGERLTNGDKLTGDVDNNSIVNDNTIDYRGDYIRWVEAGYVNIIVDLGAVMKTGKYSVHSAAGFWGYTPIKNVEVYTSIDGVNFEPVYGQYRTQKFIKYGENTLDEDNVTQIPSEVYTDYVSSGKLVSARYVMFKITPCDFGGFAGIDEVEVSAELIGDYEATYENLLSGKDYTTSTNSDKVSADNNYHADLTDGIAYRTSGDDGTWFGLRSDAFEGADANVVNDIAEMIFDLGGVYDLTSARIHFRNITFDTGVRAPKSVKLWVSVDGENYNKYVTFVVDDTDGICYWATVENIGGLVGRYVKIEIEMNSDKSNNGGGWVMLNEIEVYGNKVGSDYFASNKNPNDPNEIYGGYNDSYSGNFWFDNNDALYANRYQDYIANGKVDGTDAQYTTSFTFTGTGFDIISVTGEYNGSIRIIVKDSSDNIVVSGSKQLFSKTKTIYQATVYTCTDLTYGEYTVEVIALRNYMPSLGMKDAQVYIDSVRIYNPFENNTNVHYNDIQDGSTTETLKDIFADGNLSVDLNGGGLFTHSGSLSINNFINIGTNDAININAGQSLLLELEKASASTTMQVEMAAFDGANATVEVYVNSKLVETLNLDTGVFAYYDFSSYLRENSTVKFTVVNGNVVFTKVRYNNAELIAPTEGEKYAAGGGVLNGTAPDGELMSEDYAVNTAIIISKTGTRSVTVLVYTTANANSVIAYTDTYRIAPTNVQMSTNESGTQNRFVVTYTLPDDVPAGEVELDFYAYYSDSETAPTVQYYSSNYKTAVYNLK